MKAQGGTRARTFGLLAMSTAAHLIVFTLLGLVPPPSEVLAMEDIEIEVVEPEPQAPPPEEVADFTGVTLTAEGGASWSTVVGTGAPLKGPIGKIRTGPEEQQAAKAAPSGPRFVPAGSLSRKPRAPTGLDALLKQHYPRRARMQGVGGRALVLLRIQASGRATAVRVIEESPDGFGFATSCIEMLRNAGAFSPAIDRTGAVVATEVPFDCSFQVDDY